MGSEAVALAADLSMLAPSRLLRKVSSVIPAAMIAAALALESPAPGLSAAEQPEFVRATVEAVARRDAAFLRQLFHGIEEVKDDDAQAISAEDVLDLLAGCSPGAVRSFDGRFYTVDYRCPKRRSQAAGCDSGDLFLMVSGTLAVAHRRLVSETCPLFVPG